jgi:hypothetical protein
MRHLLMLALAAGCGDGGPTRPLPDLSVAAGDLATTPCGPSGPYGTFTISGGQSGVTACGHTFTSFTGATLVLDQATGLTVTGTGSIGDTTNCPVTVATCHVTANACPTGSNSTISYDLMIYTFQLTGRGSPSIPGPGGGCQFGYSIDGMR